MYQNGFEVKGKALTYITLKMHIHDHFVKLNVSGTLQLIRLLLTK